MRETASPAARSPNNSGIPPNLRVPHLPPPIVAAEVGWLLLGRFSARQKLRQFTAPLVYNPSVSRVQPKFMRPRLLQSCALAAALLGTSQAQPPQSASAATQPKIRVNFLNVCRPADADVQEMSRALAGLKEPPSFSADFEIARGVTTLSEAEARATGARSHGPSLWVRIRHEFPDQVPLTDAQYSLSFGAGSTDELLVLHPRESKEVLQIMISDSVTGSPLQAVQAKTPPDRIRVERFGKSSIVLARCPDADQSAYEPIFQTADEILNSYRTAMAIQTVVPAELAHLPAPKESAVRDSKTAGASK